MEDIFDTFKIYYYILKMCGIAPYSVYKVSKKRIYLIRKKDIILNILHIAILILLAIIIVLYTQKRNDLLEYKKTTTNILVLIISYANPIILIIIHNMNLYINHDSYFGIFEDLQEARDKINQLVLNYNCGSRKYIEKLTYFGALYYIYIIVQGFFFENDISLVSAIIYVMRILVQCVRAGFIFYITALLIELRYSLYYLNYYLNSLCYEDKDEKIIKGLNKGMSAYNFLCHIGRNIDKVYHLSILNFLFVSFFLTCSLMFISAIIIKENIVFNYLTIVSLFTWISSNFFELVLVLSLFEATKHQVSNFFYKVLCKIILILSLITNIFNFR